METGHEEPETPAEECRSGRDPRGSSGGVFVSLRSGASLPQSGLPTALHVILLFSSSQADRTDSS